MRRAVYGRQPSEAAAQTAAAIEGHRSIPSGFDGLMDAYYDALATGAALPVSLDDARRSLELVTALYHSAAIGAAVTLPIARDHPNCMGW